MRRAFLENKVDFAVIAVSIPAHLTVIKTVLEVQPGCHILSEKPVAGSMAECRQIEALVRAAGVKCAFTFSHRYEQDKQSLERLLASGKYGSIDSIVGRLIVKKQPTDRADEMLLINGGCHYIDMLEVFAGSSWKSVYAQIWEHAWEQRGCTSHNAFVMCEMQNGVHAALEILLGSADDRNGWCNENFRIECDRACIEAERGELFEKYTDERGERIVKKLPLEEGEHWKHDLIIRKFIAWLDGGKEPDIGITGAMRAMDFLFAAVESAKTGQVIYKRDCRSDAGELPDNTPDRSDVETERLYREYYTTEHGQIVIPLPREEAEAAKVYFKAMGTTPRQALLPALEQILSDAKRNGAKK